MRKSLLIAADVDPDLERLAIADGRFDVRVHPVRTDDELVEIVPGAQILVTRAYSKVTRSVIEAAPGLELIAQATSGIDNIDADAAAEREVAILNLPGHNANAVAELVIGWTLALTRTVPFYTREVAGGRWQREDCATRHEMRFYRLGIIGLGRVGSRVARLAAAFGMSSMACDPYLSDSDFEACGVRRIDSVADLITVSDVVTVHVPLTSKTRNMIDADAIRRMRPGTILINAARGGIVDQAAALEALRLNHLGGLALDVFEQEPPAATFPDDPRLILTPHIAGCTHECRSGVGATLFRKISDFYATRVPSR